MATEIERKFLVANDGWRAAAGRGVRMVQGYFESGICTAPPPTLRVRIAGERAFLTVKGRPSGVSRSEFEYEIPVADAEAMLLEFCGTRIVERSATPFRPETACSGRSTSISNSMPGFSPPKSSCLPRRPRSCVPTGSVRRFPAIRAIPTAPSAAIPTRSGATDIRWATVRPPAGSSG